MQLANGVKFCGITNRIIVAKQENKKKKKTENNNVCKMRPAENGRKKKEHKLTSIAIAINMNLKYVHMFFFPLLNGEIDKNLERVCHQKMPCRRFECNFIFQPLPSLVFYYCIFFFSPFSSANVKSIRSRYIHICIRVTTGTPVHLEPRLIRWHCGLCVCMMCARCVSN